MAYASAKAAKKFDDTKDYIFSTWDDNQLRSWLETHDVISTPAPTGRAALLNNVRVAYLKATDPIYEAWSTSSLHDWLVEHGVVQPEPTARDKLLDLMKSNYFDAKDTAYSRWKDSEMRDWLVSEGVMWVTPISQVMTDTDRSSVRPPLPSSKGTSTKSSSMSTTAEPSRLSGAAGTTLKCDLGSSIMVSSNLISRPSVMR